MAFIFRRMRAFSLAAFFAIGGFVTSASANPENGTPSVPNKDDSSPILIQQMMGTWSVQQRMWLSSDAEATNLPPAIAHRQLMAGGFLQEIMEPLKKSKETAFIRTAYFNYNAVNQQYEYFSLDSRAPQMMNERSDKVDGRNLKSHEEIKLHGGSFIAPQWGEAKNMAFTYRLTVGEINNNSQTVRLYLTPQSRESAKEFLAFEYIYTPFVTGSEKDR